MAGKTYNGLPLFEASIEDGDQMAIGMIRISLVDYPAVESDFVKFAKNDRPMMYAVQDEEKRIVRGVVMRAGFPIYRNDPEWGEYYTVYNADTVREMAEKYLFDGRQNDVNLMHEQGTDVEGVNMVQFFIKDSAKGVNPEGFEEIEDGSLFAEFHVQNDVVWEQIKSGEYKGFSLEGRFFFNRAEESQDYSVIDKVFTKLFKTQSMSKLAKFKAMLAELLSEENVKLGSMTTDKGVLSWDGEEDLKPGDEVFILTEAGERIAPEDGEYATEDKVVVVADGKVAEIKDKPAEGESTEGEETEKPEGEAEAELSEEGKEGEESEKPSGDLEDRVAKIEGILEQLMDYFGIMRLKSAKQKEIETGLAEVKAELAKIKTAPAGEPAHKSFQKVNEIKPTGHKGIDNLMKFMGE